ncbi:MAG TPA: response regulator, partial [Syntrophales bacterium]|nr:response regulator [Syntrophales bacterium]
MEDSGQSETKTRILIVDDHVELRDMLREAMVIYGYDCLTAGNGREALDCLAADPVDVVLTDIKMPEMNGLELTEQIKQNYDVGVIVMTGYTDDFSYEDIITKGASDFMVKPVAIPELDLRIKRVVREKALLRERNQAMEKLRESEQRYQELSITDGLTKLFNSRQFYAVLHGEIERSNRYDHPLTVLMLDIDDFKKYNDTYG